MSRRVQHRRARIAAPVRRALPDWLSITLRVAVVVIVVAAFGYACTRWYDPGPYSGPGTHQRGRP